MSSQPTITADHKFTEADLLCLKQTRDTLVECNRIAKRISSRLARYARSVAQSKAAAERAPG